VHKLLGIRRLLNVNRQKKMTTPSVLTNINNTPWSNVYEFRWWSSSGSLELYSLHDLGTGTWRSNDPLLYSIQFDTVTNVWSDHGTGDPSFCGIQSNNTVLCRQSGTDVYRFSYVIPVSGSGGGTSTETLIKSVDNTPVTGGTSNESFDPAAWVWNWYGVSNQVNDIIRTTIVNISGQPSSSFGAFLTDKVSGITSAITGVVIADNPTNSAEYVVTIELPEATIKDSIILITGPNDYVVGEVDLEPVVLPVVPPSPVFTRKVFSNFW
jgi:hypothetical protein